MSESLGQRLRAAREARGLLLDEVERITRIRAKFLAAFEADDFSGLPSETQARGFLRNYAEYLGLDAAELLSKFDSGRRLRQRLVLSPTRPRRTTATPPNGTQPLPPRPAPTENMGRAPQILSRRPRWLSPDLFFAVGVSVVIVMLLVWAVGQLTPGLTAAPTPTLPLVVPGQTLAPTATRTPTPASTPTLALPTPLPEYVGVNISLRAEQRIWVSVKVDGVEQFAGQMAAGEIKDFVGQSVVEIATGNGLGTRVIWNGRDQGALGKLGEAVIRLWTVEGILLPTPTATPTATP
jgi:transcriptional regulator with XRE-family HTH domain